MQLIASAADPVQQRSRGDGSARTGRSRPGGAGRPGTGSARRAGTGRWPAGRRCWCWCGTAVSSRPARRSSASSPCAGEVRAVAGDVEVIPARAQAPRLPVAEVRDRDRHQPAPAAGPRGCARGRRAARRCARGSAGTLRRRSRTARAHCRRVSPRGHPHRAPGRWRRPRAKARRRPSASPRRSGRRRGRRARSRRRRRARDRRPRAPPPGRWPTSGVTAGGG